MDTVQSIFEKFGGVNGVVEATGCPQQTVSSWGTRSPPDIPPWRRPQVASAAHARKIDLTEEERLYLASNDRRPRARQTTPADTQAAA
jgi:hypothetical protein